MVYESMKEIVYKQARPWDCADYAILSACQKLWVWVTEGNNIYREELSIQAVADRLVKEWKIQWLALVRVEKSIDMWLARGHYIVAGTGKLSFTSVSKPPFLQKFDGNIGHNFCIVEDCGDKWKVKDSQWPNFADGWYWYILKSDLPKIEGYGIVL